MVSRSPAYLDSRVPRATRIRSARSLSFSSCDSGITMMDRLAGNHRFEAPISISLVGAPQPQGWKLGLRAGLAAVDPQVVGELVQVTVRAGEQIPGGHRGAAGRPARGRGPPGAPDVLEAGQVGTERVGVGVAELR